jgi:hypothetical protein
MKASFVIDLAKFPRKTTFNSWPPKIEKLFRFSFPFFLFFSLAASYSVGCQLVSSFIPWWTSRTELCRREWSNSLLNIFKIFILVLFDFIFFLDFCPTFDSQVHRSRGSATPTVHFQCHGHGCTREQNY